MVEDRPCDSDASCFSLAPILAATPGVLHPPSPPSPIAKRNIRVFSLLDVPSQPPMSLACMVPQLIKEVIAARTLIPAEELGPFPLFGDLPKSPVPSFDAEEELPPLVTWGRKILTAEGV